MKKKEQLSQKESELLREYLSALEELGKREPEVFPFPDFDDVMCEIQETGEIPERYRGMIGEEEVKDKVTGETHKAYYDVAWDEWNKERAQLNAKYHDVVYKALELALKNGIGNDISSAVQLLESLLSDFPAVSACRPGSIDFPVDKINGNVWKLLKDTQAELKIKFDVKTSGSQDPINILYLLDFSDLKNASITRKLDIYDKRVYCAISGLFNSGNEYISIQQIYNWMGYKGRPGASDINKINTSISKMNGAKLYIDNLAESNAYNYDLFRYDGQLLPMERVTGFVKGQVAESVIHVFREPPLISFARQRKQITTIAVKLLDSPLSKTAANMELEDYLLERISHMKKGKIRKKMLLNTIYENTGIKTVKQKQRAPEKIKKLLEHYKSNGFIKGYKFERDGVSISC